MKLSAINILRKTHYGAGVYAYILATLENKAPLSPQLLLFSPVRNPFTGGRKTLLIELRDGMSVHRDLDDSNFKGDVFDFAELYFKSASREELYFMINQAMNLGLRPQAELDFLEQEDDTWSPRVSLFHPPISNTRPVKSLSLAEVGELIAGDTYKSITQELRQLKDKEAQRRFKVSRFSYVTFSGSFTRRNEQGLLQHSGLLAIDFDHLPFIEEIKQLLLEDGTYATELLFVSPSGDGLKWVLRFDPEQRSQKSFFAEVATYLLREYRLQVDVAPKDVSRACFLAWDPNFFLHPRHRRVVSSE